MPVTLPTDATLPAPVKASAKSLQKSLHKGQQTRAAILEAALGLASHMGLEGLSIGALAEVTQMSKSGVFAHFGSREELQISVIREYHARFEVRALGATSFCGTGFGLHLHQRRR
jgi:AcrR family transcriptional regulator